MNFMANNVGNRVWGLHQGFEMYEIEKFKRVVYDILNFLTYQQKQNEQDVIVHRARFYDFVNEMDKRHNKNFLERQEIDEQYLIQEFFNIFIIKLIIFL